MGGTASRPLEPSAVRTKRVAVSTAQVKIKQEGSVVGAGGPPVRERAVITQNKEPLKAKEAAKPKAPSEPVVVDKKGKGAKVVVRPANAEPLQTTDDEDAPGATNELIPELRVPKLKIAGKAAKLGKTKRVPKVGSAISAAKAKAIKRKKAKSADPKSSKVRIGEGRFTLQVKATKSKGEADEFMRALRRKNFFPHLIVVDTPKKGRFYRIRVGRFETMEEARAFQREFGARSGQSESGYVTRLQSAMIHFFTCRGLVVHPRPRPRRPVSAFRFCKVRSDHSGRRRRCRLSAPWLSFRILANDVYSSRIGGRVLYGQLLFS